MKLGQIVDRLVLTYRQVEHNNTIAKPFSYALYQTWKWCDDNEKPRKKEVPNVKA